MKKVFVFLLVAIILCVILMFILSKCIGELDTRKDMVSTNPQKTKCIDTLKIFKEKGFINEETYRVILVTLNEEETRIEIDKKKEEAKFFVKISIGAIILCLSGIFMTTFKIKRRI